MSGQRSASSATVRSVEISHRRRRLRGQLQNGLGWSVIIARGSCTSTRVSATSVPYRSSIPPTPPISEYAMGSWRLFGATSGTSRGPRGKAAPTISHTCQLCGGDGREATAGNRGDGSGRSSKTTTWATGECSIKNGGLTFAHAATRHCTRRQVRWPPPARRYQPYDQDISDGARRSGRNRGGQRQPAARRRHTILRSRIR